MLCFLRALGATFVPGRDALGRPVIPAEPPKEFDTPFPEGISLDINLGTKKFGSKEIEVHGGPVPLDGYSWNRDCLSSPK